MWAPQLCVEAPIEFCGESHVSKTQQELNGTTCSTTECNFARDRDTCCVCNSFFLH